MATSAVDKAIATGVTAAVAIECKGWKPAHRCDGVQKRTVRVAAVVKSLSTVELFCAC